LGSEILRGVSCALDSLDAIRDFTLPFRAMRGRLEERVRKSLDWLLWAKSIANDQSRSQTGADTLPGGPVVSLAQSARTDWLYTNEYGICRKGVFQRAYVFTYRSCVRRGAAERYCS
jgi:hypothetical protein